MTAVDSNIVIYLFDSESPQHVWAQSLFTQLAEQETVVASVMLWTEVLSWPHKQSAALGRRAEEQLKMLDFIKYQDVTKNIADAAAKLMIKIPKKLSNADAIHLATALECGADCFYTNDKDLLALKQVGSLRIRGLQ